MDVFNLRKALVRDYVSYIRSLIQICDGRMAESVANELGAGLIWPGPLVHISPALAFPIVKGKDEKERGSYRTKDIILTFYDRLQQAAEAGAAYETVLDSPPASPEVARPPREVEA